MSCRYSLAMVAALLIICLPLTAISQVFNFQGELRDNAGLPVPDASYNMTFKVFDAETGGTELSTESQAVSVTGGLFNAGILWYPDPNLTRAEVYIELTIDGETLSPRTPIGTVPFAAVARGIDWEVDHSAVQLGADSSGAGQMITWDDILWHASIGTAADSSGAGQMITWDDILWHASIGTTADSSGAGQELAFGSSNVGRSIEQVVDSSQARVFVYFLENDDYSSIEQVADSSGASLTVSEFDGVSYIDTAIYRAGGISMHHSDDGGVSFDSIGIGIHGIDFFIPESYGRYGPDGVGFVRVLDSTWRINAAGDAFFGGDVGIGTSTPAGPFHVSFSEGQGLPYNLDPWRQVVITDNQYGGSGGGLAIISGDNGTGGLWFGDNITVAQGALLYDHDISEMRLLAGSTERMRIDHMGRVGIGESDPMHTLDVNGDIQCDNLFETSDGRYKRDVREIEGALSKVSELRGVTFVWNREESPDQNFDDENHLGFIAQEVQQVVPEIVSEGEDGYLSMDYGKLTPLLVQAIKEQQSEIDELNRRVAELAVAMETLLADQEPRSSSSDMAANH